MTHSTTFGSPLAVRAWIFWLSGWILFLSSIAFARANDSSEPPFIFQFWFSFGVLVTVAVSYLILQMISDVWKSKVVRFFFSPYLIGAACWVFLILLTLLLDQLG